MTLSETREVAKGRVWTGEDALQHGLVDQLGGLADAVHLAKQQAGLSQVTSGHCNTALPSLACNLSGTTCEAMAVQKLKAGMAVRLTTGRHALSSVIACKATPEQLYILLPWHAPWRKSRCVLSHVRVHKGSSCGVQEDDAVEVIDFPPPKSFIQLLREAVSKQPQGFGMLAAAASLMEPQLSDASVLTPLLWLAMAHQPGLQSHALLPGAAAHVNGVPDITSMITGRASYMSHLGGVQMLQAPMHVE